MSQEQFKAFLEKAKGDASLQEQLKAASDKEAVVKIANGQDFSIDIKDFEQVEAELSDDELEAAVGGKVTDYIQQRNTQTVTTTAKFFEKLFGW